MKIMGLKEVKLQMMNTSLTLQSSNRTCTNPVFKKSPREKTTQEKNHQIQKKTLVRLEILSGVLVVNTNQWLLIQKTFATCINIKFVKVISKVYFHSFFKYFCPVIYQSVGSKNSVVLGFCLFSMVCGRIVFLTKMLR